MDITTNDDWTWVGGEYKTAFATTSDPRVVAVIERDDEYGGGHIDGDVYAPAFYFERGRKSAAGSTFTDAASDEIAEAWATAHYYLVNRRYIRPKAPRIDVEQVLARYMRCFFGTTVAQVGSSIDQGTEVVIFNTPSWREHVGWTDEYAAKQPEDIRLTEEMLAGSVHDWKAALDGEVYGIGYATNVARVMDDGFEIDLEDGQWTVDSWLCGGFLGEDYAKESAARFDAGTPDLPEMLEEDDIFGPAKAHLEASL